MICPIMSARQKYDSVSCGTADGIMVNCLKAECAWWIQMECAINSLVRDINLIAQIKQEEMDH